MSDDKAQSALAMLARGLTLGEAASELGYKKPEALGQLLRRRGFRFDKDQGTYVRANPATARPEPTAKEDRPDADLIALTTEARQLLQRAAEVLALLDTGKGALADSLSSPLVKGPKITKSFRLSEPLTHKVEIFAAECRLTQQEVFTAAVGEFIERRAGHLVAAK